MVLPVVAEDWLEAGTSMKAANRLILGTSSMIEKVSRTISGKLTKWRLLTICPSEFISGPSEGDSALTVTLLVTTQICSQKFSRQSLFYEQLYALPTINLSP